VEALKAFDELLLFCFYPKQLINSKQLYMKRRKFIQSAVVGTAGLGGIVSSAKATFFNMSPDPEVCMLSGPLKDTLRI
jgi:hypothetical protein